MFSIKMNNIGITKMPNKVSRCHTGYYGNTNGYTAPAPAPLEIASGIQPKMNAKDVIKIGRKRIFAASIAASTKRMPRSSTRILAYSIIKIAFFAAKPTKVNNKVKKKLLFLLKEWIPTLSIFSFEWLIFHTILLSRRERHSYQCDGQ